MMWDTLTLLLEFWFKIAAHILIWITWEKVGRIRAGCPAWCLDEINIDASGRHSTRSTSVGDFIRDYHGRIIMAKEKQIGDYPILLAEYWLSVKLL